MQRGLRPFVGRAAEIGALTDSLQDAARGSGGVWLIAGEPGIGKSRLVEEVAREAGERFRVHWGRCWEAGGAPAYWPWIQVLREVVGDLDPAAIAPALRQLLPELRSGGPAPVTESSPERARFALLDAATGALIAAAEIAPRLIVLDDLHAADGSSVVLLDFLSHAVRGAPVLVLGTFRETEAHAGEAGALLHQVARRAQTLVLPRLDRREVGELVGRVVGDQDDALPDDALPDDALPDDALPDDALPDDALIDVVFSRSEGNPLFAESLARVLAGPGGLDRAKAIPPTVRTAIRQHLNAIDDSAAELLSMAAIWGREIDPERLAAMSGQGRDAIAKALADAERRHLVVPTGAGGVRFAHILTREVALAELDAERRDALHLQAADLLEATDAPGSEIAFHCLEAGAAGRGRAVDAAVRAGREARDQLAFDEAVRWLGEALAALDSDPHADAARRTEVLTELGGARFRAGDDEGGRRACLEAAGAARDLGRSDLLALAALELGSVLRFARVDDRLVSLLQEAAAALGEHVSPLRARVLARLAAALQPAEDPSVPVELATEAIEMARDIGDPEVLLATLRTGGSALIDMVTPSRRIDAQREHLHLARELGDRAEQLRAASRVAMTSFELGDLAGAEAAIEEVGRIAAELDNPGFSWRVEAFAATRALWRGEFAAAENAIARYQSLAADAGDNNARATALYQRLRLYRLTGRDLELTALVPQLRDMFGHTPTAAPYGVMLATSAALQIGREASDAVGSPALLYDWTTRGVLAEIARIRGDRDLAAEVRTRLEDAHDTFIVSGVLGMTWEEPAHHALANAHRALGDDGAAVRHLEAGIDAAAAIGGAPVVAWLSVELAELLAGTEERDRVSELAGRAAEIASELGMRGVLVRATALSGEPAVSAGVPGAAAGLAIEPDGDGFALRRGGKTLRLKKTKGLVFLAALVGSPGKEIHVLDLAGDRIGDAPIDLGDAGEHLDAQARDAYRARVRDLRAELDDAESANDLGRAEKARAELEFLTAELARAVGLRGERRAGQAAERARVNVQRRIRDAIRKIAEHDADLARHLERSIRTGRFCCYEPA